MKGSRRPASFDFDEDQLLFFAANDFDFTVTTVEVSFKDEVSVLFQVFTGQSFSIIPSFLRKSFKKLKSEAFFRFS